ncbi:carbohydrate ABC transporter permease [Cohnella thailandensis]|uniref:Carbohydrate ABC transporter permease n=1 Tax=Cohnella thailandensis TaxID=557557 RepID=A0A841SY46_9BACL|nr:carbohydrate ABC transporter permease [Cohnella thailandensis]MBB6637153.1 carbohydrate ABC transporter permease [Cohnella thailandensis]MBP1977029.1 putative aldouronate transport system permease protein [Cohnella thailandensis]
MKSESRGLTWFSHISLFLFAAFCLIPFVLLISASLTDQNAIVAQGYSFIPHKFSTDAYDYLINRGSDIARAYGVTIFVTVFGTVAGLALTTLLAYPLSRKETPHRFLIMFIVFFTMLFHGGLIPSYLVYTQLFEIKNTIWALIIPGLLTNGFYVMMMRTFFQTTVPPALIESAHLDGASEYRTLWSVVLPLSTPVLATVGLFTCIMYWNDWQNGMIYITNPDYFSVQNLLNRIMQDIQYINSNMAGNAGEALSQMPTDSVKMAIAVIGVLPILVAYPFFQKYFIKGIMIGAVKG